ncbi:Small G Protein Signaling Modulator 1 [Manis pentadactyla]|nr:Small G Protein Signaling Modulator 1 [Manis pentadactyla]
MSGRGHGSAPVVLRPRGGSLAARWWAERKQHADEATLKCDFHFCWALWPTAQEGPRALESSLANGLEVVCLLTRYPWWSQAVTLSVECAQGVYVHASA